MTIFSIFCALLIEQLKPLRANNGLYGLIKVFASKIEQSLNVGLKSHGKIAWFIAIGSLALPTGLIYWTLLSLSIWAALFWNILIVYLTLGFRHYSHHFSAIQYALDNGDLISARNHLSKWLKRDTSDMEAPEISRLTIEQALITSHRNVLGSFFWFLIPIGPAGAVIYRLSEYLARAWNEPQHLQKENFGDFAKRMFYWIDWIPVRLSATTFAIVGNFEDAIYAWRSFSKRWPNPETGIILASGSGALGVRLGEPETTATQIIMADAATVDSLSNDPDSTPGAEASLRALNSTVGLLWRALLLWMLLFFMFSVTTWLT